MDGLLQSQHSVQRKVKGKKIVHESDEDDDFMQFMTSKKGAMSKAGINAEQAKLVMMKDNPYTIFHALGKFLYNKSNHLSLLIHAYRNQPQKWEDWVIAIWNDGQSP